MNILAENPVNCMAAEGVWLSFQATNIASATAHTKEEEGNSLDNDLWSSSIRLQSMLPSQAGLQSARRLTEPMNDRSPARGPSQQERWTLAVPCTTHCCHL